MSWKLVTAHRIAHLGTNLGSGTVKAGSSEFFLPVLDIDKRTEITAASVFRWDRSTNTNRGDINCLLLLRHNLQSSSATVTIYSDNTTLGGTTQTKLAATTPGTDGDYFTTWSGTGMGYRYWRADLSAACTVGTLSLGYYYDLGEARVGGSLGVETSANTGDTTPWGASFRRSSGRGSRTISRTFGRLAMNTIRSILDDAASEFVQPSTTPSGFIDGIGGGGGANPLALVDGSGNVYFGPAQITANEYAPGYGELSVSITTDAGGLL